MQQNTPTSGGIGIHIAEWSSARKNGIDKEKQMYYRNTHDLTQLQQITLDSVLECLVERFRSRDYHTFAGPVLISLNPCLKSSRNTLEEIQSRLHYENIEKIIRSPPHVYTIGQQSLKNLQTIGNHQIIVVSGDSGAGKTTATQQLIKYFIERNSRLAEVKTPTNLDKKIYFATLILESLGNASTVANHNSSRFGRLVQLTLDTDTSSIVGAKIRTCLLEKNRISKCSIEERNFHIFYYLLIAMKKGFVNIQDYADNAAPDGKYLIPQEFKDSVTIEDEEDFQILYKSLQGLKLTSELDNIFRIVFGIMVLLNVRFVPRDEDDFIDNANINKDTDSRKEFTVSDSHVVETLGNIFGIDGDDLVQAMVSRKITAGAPRRKSVFIRKCETIQECQERLSAMACVLYDALFHHVLVKLNRMLLSKPESSNTNDWSGYEHMKNADSTRQLSLLDLYGFENFEKNHLEQLCINYANERLQHVHVTKIKSYFDQMTEMVTDFEEPKELLRVEKEMVERINDLESTVISILNEECLLNRGNQIKVIFDRMSITTKSSKYVQFSKFETESCPFIVKHYASDVQYQLNGMIAKNADYIPPEFYEVFGSSENYFVKSLVNLSQNGSDENGNKNVQSRNINNKKSQTGKTILQRFKLSVDELVKELVSDENHDIHFIRCIRPNSELTEGKIQYDVVKRQLFSSGIVDIIRIAGNGYPIRISKQKFVQQFSALLRRHCEEGLDENVLKKVLPFDGSELKFGKNMVFMSESCWKFMKGMEKCVTIGYVLKIQRAWRNCLQIKQEKEMDQKLFNSPETAESVSEDDEFYSPRAGPFGDMMEKFETNEPYFKTGLNSTISKMEKLIQRKSFENVKQNFQGFCDQPIYIGDRIVSRSQIYKPPIKFFTRKTSLTNAHMVPKRLKPKGVLDAFDDIGALKLMCCGDETSYSY